MMILRIILGFILISLGIIALVANRNSLNVSFGFVDKIKSIWNNTLFRLGVIFTAFHFNMSLIGTYPFDNGFYNNIFLSSKFQLLLLIIGILTSFFDENKKVKSAIHRVSSWIVVLSVLNLGLYTYFSFQKIEIKPQSAVASETSTTAKKETSESESFATWAGKNVREFFGIKDKEITIYKNRWSENFKPTKGMKVDFGFDKLDKINILVIRPDGTGALIKYDPDIDKNGLDIGHFISARFMLNKNAKLDSIKLKYKYQ